MDSEPKLRAIEEQDMPLLFEWRNLDQIVAMSSTQRAVTWEEHTAWFSRIFNDKNCIVYIVEQDNKPIGQIRFDLDGKNQAVVSIYLLPEYCGRGLGTSTLRSACGKLQERHPGLHAVQAKIRADNPRSMRSFEKAGFLAADAHGGEADLTLMTLALHPPDEIKHMETTVFQQEQKKVIDAYSRRLREHGQDVRSLNWGSRASQERRFEVLMEAGIEPGMSLLDVGCGLGDFLLWTKRRGTEIDYTGLDVTPGMVEFCREQHRGHRFETGDIATWNLEAAGAYDFVIASGIFYDRPESGHEYMERAVRAMFRLCRKGIAFNTITALADQTFEKEFRPCLGELAELCAEFSHSFVLRHDYHPCDATLYLFKTAKL
jgi:RimJ/RimL family protein N-acetyltransferase/ubiquinone/menaquinone biosynthesis C-methylase UbiE